MRDDANDRLNGREAGNSPFVQCERRPNGADKLGSTH